MAHADDVSQDDEAHVKRGVELRTSGKNRDALDEFQKAYAIHPAPRTRAQIALAYQALGEWIEAERGLVEALAVADDPWIARYRGVLEGSLVVVRTHLGWLDVVANVTGADVLLDGVKRGTLPLSSPLRVVAGSVVIEVRAAGYVPARRNSEVVAAKRAREVLALEPQVAPRVALPVAPPLAAASPVASPESSDSPSAAKTRRIEGISALGGAVLFAGAGIASWRVHEWNIDKYNDDGQCLVAGRTRDETCGGNGTMAKTSLILEIGAFALAGVSAGIGTWLLATKPSHAASSAQTACGPAAGLGIVCRGVF